MKKNLCSLCLLTTLLSITFFSCSKDGDTEDGNKSTFTVNGTPSYASEMGDFLNSDFLGSNFSDNSLIDGCLYTYACYYSKDVPNPFTEISLYFSPVDFTTAKKGEQLKISKDDTHASQCWIATINSGSINYFEEFKGGSIAFESFDAKNKLLRLRFNKLVFSDDSNKEMILDGVAVFVFQSR